MEQAEVTARAHELCLRDELVARHDLALELDVLHAAEQCDLAAVLFWIEHGDAADLCHRLEDQDARHLMALVYTLTIWAVILLAPHFLISIFSSDPTLQADTIPAMKLYFSTFGFMLLQYVGQTVFKSLNKRRHAVFFSLLRKVIIVVPLTYLLPYAFGMGTDGVFAAEPVSNVIGGSLCFIVMLITVLPELKRMDREDAKTAK